MNRLLARIACLLLWTAPCAAIAGVDMYPYSPEDFIVTGDNEHTTSGFIHLPSLNGGLVVSVKKGTPSGTNESAKGHSQDDSPRPGRLYQPETWEGGGFGGGYRFDLHGQSFDAAFFAFSNSALLNGSFAGFLEGRLPGDLAPPNPSWCDSPCFVFWDPGLLDGPFRDLFDGPLQRPLVRIARLLFHVHCPPDDPNPPEDDPESPNRPDPPIHHAPTPSSLILLAIGFPALLSWRRRFNRHSRRSGA